jgi:hypothetical protein
MSSYDWRFSCEFTPRFPMDCDQCGLRIGPRLLRLPRLSPQQPKQASLAVAAIVEAAV